MNYSHSNHVFFFFFFLQLCIKKDDHSESRMTYLFIKSVNMGHSGTYTCRDSKNRTKSVYINVQG